MPSREVAAVIAVVLVVLVGGGYVSKPLWQPWWYAGTICDGLLSADDLADVLPDKELQAGKEEADLAHGRLKCGVDTDDGHFSLVVDVESDPDEVDRELTGEFTIPTRPRFVFPSGIPGFQSDLGHYIVQDCPDLRRDSSGRKRRLVTRVIGAWDEKNGTPATLRIAVSLANGVSQKLGCGAPELPLPKRAVIEEKAVAPAEGGANCGWLGRVRLPKNPSGKPWRVVSTEARTPITSCTLVDAASGQPYADFSGWYGNWTDTSFATLIGANVALPNHFEGTGPLMSEHFGTAAARCDGESAHYEASTYPVDQARSLPARELRPLLVAFARDQAERRGCTRLQLPGKRIYPNRR
ncbi:hypothetical protein [Streptomyces inhibens]|uniref:hypothetical protein n=1 Tax=Streptomyces inhibens TaxID=2293571 RepID=UPI000FFB14BE|nr:hypothetical protein [Streptomyces inhibens]